MQNPPFFYNARPLSDPADLTLASAARTLLGPGDAERFSQTLEKFGDRIFRLNLAGLTLIAILIVVALISVLAWLADRSATPLLPLAALALTVAGTVIAGWRVAPHRARLRRWVGRTLALPPRIVDLLEALAAGLLEARGPGAAVADPALFGGAFAPLLLSRARRYRALVRTPTGEREREMLTLARAPFEAWRQHRSGIADTPEPTLSSVSSTPGAPVEPRRLKSLWIHDLHLTRQEFDIRMAELDPPGSPKESAMTRVAMKAALGFLMDNPSDGKPADALDEAVRQLRAQFGHTGRKLGSDSVKWIEAMLANPPAWLLHELRTDRAQPQLALE